MLSNYYSTYSKKIAIPTRTEVYIQLAVLRITHESISFNEH